MQGRGTSEKQRISLRIVPSERLARCPEIDVGEKRSGTQRRAAFRMAPAPEVACCSGRARQAQDEERGRSGPSLRRCRPCQQPGRRRKRPKLPRVRRKSGKAITAEFETLDASQAGDCEGSRNACRSFGNPSPCPSRRERPNVPERMRREGSAPLQRGLSPLARGPVSAPWFAIAEVSGVAIVLAKTAPDSRGSERLILPRRTFSPTGISPFTISKHLVCRRPCEPLSLPWDEGSRAQHLIGDHDNF